MCLNVVCFLRSWRSVLAVVLDVPQPCCLHLVESRDDSQQSSRALNSVPSRVSKDAHGRMIFCQHFPFLQILWLTSRKSANLQTWWPCLDPRQESSLLRRLLLLLVRTGSVSYLWLSSSLPHSDFLILLPLLSFLVTAFVLFFLVHSSFVYPRIFNNQFSLFAVVFL